MITPNYDPYATIPFTGYRRAGSNKVDQYLSLMHFVESEKFRGVDESYRQYLLSLDDLDDFILETIGVAQGVRRSDWDEIKSGMIRAGMWMQLVQQQDLLVGSLLHPGCQTGIDLVTQAADEVYRRLVAAQHEEGQDLRRVVLTGDLSLTEREITSLFDQFFANRLPDEIILATEDGVSLLAEGYAIQRYLPVRHLNLSAMSPEAAAQEAMTKGTHVFAICSADKSDSPFAECVLAAATSAGKVAHRIKWN